MLMKRIYIILLAGMLVLGCAEAIQAQELTEATELTETIVPAETQSSIVVKKGNTFYCGDQQMNRAAYKQFLQNECPQAYRKYKQGQQCMIAGWALFGGGLVGSALTGPMWFVSAFGNSASSKTDSKPSVANRSLLSAGLLFGAAVIASVPLLSVGYVKMDNRSVKTYNEQCAKQNVEVAFELTGNGVGLALRF